MCNALKAIISPHLIFLFLILCFIFLLYFKWINSAIHFILSEVFNVIRNPLFALFFLCRMVRCLQRHKLCNLHEYRSLQLVRISSFCLFVYWFSIKIILVPILVKTSNTFYCLFNFLQVFRIKCLAIVVTY